MTAPAAPAVVTVTYESGGVLPAFFRSLREAGATGEIVVVDNASPNPGDLAEIVAEAGARLVSLADNRGYGAAANAGIATLDPTTDLVVIANPDVEFAPGSLDVLAAAARARDDAASFGPLVLQSDGQPYPSARNLPSLRTGIGHALFGSVWPANPWTRSYRQSDQLAERDAGWLSGSCLLVRRSAFEDIGGFDEGYFMYFEDVDLGARFARAGWSNRYVPAAVVTHTGAHSTSRHRREMESAHHRSAYRYIATKYSPWYLAPLRLALRIGIGIRERLSR
jgi:N-acetylglucosaminyl-diphospho-decaprenol L-rhamnosyltransferase